MSNQIVSLTWSDGASIAGVVAASAAVVALLVSVIGYVRSRLRTHREREVAVAESFKQIVRGLSDENENQRFASAVLLRRFFDRRSEYGAYLPFSADVVSVIAAVLRGEPVGHLQKLLADGLAYAPSLKKADLQNANLRNAYLSKVDVSGADFFRSDLSYASLKGSHAVGATFYQALLLGTIFEGADLRTADFFEADLSNARFDGARLAGAKFASVRRMPACIREKLDEAGIYQCAGDEVCLDPREATDKGSQSKVFLSEPRTVTSYQRSVMAVVREVLEEVGLTVETAASSSYSSSSPLHYVSSAIERCDGTVVLGIPQLDVDTGRLKPGTSEERFFVNQKLPTPWNQIEAAISIAYNRPVLVVRDGTVGGIFDLPGDGEDLVHFDLGLPWDLDGLRVAVRTWALKLGHHDDGEGTRSG